MNFTNLMYAKGADDRKRRWDSESMRVASKKKILDRLSSVICHHRVRDFIFLGIPNRRLDLAQVQAQAQAQAQVQAQIPAFLAEAHADAEAQAQVQGAQVEVGEVSDVSSNVNSAYSPVVVS
jgi:primosomal replication protein N